MGHILTVTIQRGGAGKTTTAAATAAGLSIRGYRTLLIDLDAQGNLSFSAGASTAGKGALDVLTGSVAAADAIQSTGSGDIIAAAPALSTADNLITETGKEYRLKEALEPLRARYDYIIIDTPPALGILTINALAASTGVIIPIQADIYSLMGADQLNATIQPVRKYCNPELRIEGLLLTRYNPRTVLSRDIAGAAADLAKRMETKLFRATIREAVAVKEAQASRKTLYQYAPNAKVTADYTAFITELLEGIDK